MMTLPRRVAARAFLLYDRAYHRLHRLQAVDDLLLISRGIYKGSTRQFADGTRLQNGDAMGVIHFNNRFLSRVQTRSGNNSSSKRAAFAFGAALIRSLEQLAKQFAESPDMHDLQVIGGVTWFKAHGQQIGFEIEPVAPGPRQRLLRAHFRLMLSLLYPHLAERENHRLEPHQFWMTRSQLQQLAASRRVHTAERLVKYERKIV